MISYMHKTSWNHSYNKALRIVIPVYPFQSSFPSHLSKTMISWYRTITCTFIPTAWATLRVFLTGLQHRQYPLCTEFAVHRLIGNHLTCIMHWCLVEEVGLIVVYNCWKHVTSRHSPWEELIPCREAKIFMITEYMKLQSSFARNTVLLILYERKCFCFGRFTLILKKIKQWLVQVFVLCAPCCANPGL